MTICDRCLKPLDQGEHGQYKCPLEARPAHGVVGDDIPGGMEIKHGLGLCNPDGSPKRYYSKSAIAKRAKAAGWTNYVQHTGSRGSDKNPHTQRFV